MFLGSGCQNESNSYELAPIGEKKIFREYIRKFFMNSAMSSLQSFFMNCLQSRNHLFLSSVFQNESNSHQLARIGEKKIFHEHDVHHVYKVGVTCFWAQDTKMSLTAISSLESARRKFFMKSTYIMSTKLESLVFGLRMPK